MWLFTTTGFISAVYKEGALQVRARDSESLESLARLADATIVCTPYADYPYRVITDHETFGKWMQGQISALTYPNFKSEIAATRGYAYAKPLNKVWSVMHEVEDSEARQ
jgi:hypothetical protein